MSPEVVVFPDLDAAAAEAAERIASICDRAVASRGACAIALSGGDSPKPLFARLAAEPYRRRMPWERLQVFWSDERCVPPDDPRSNYKLAHDLLLAKVPVPKGQIFRMPGGAADPPAAAAAYEQTLRAHLPATADGWPRFDIVLLGLGANAHTASLFPRTAAVRERDRAVVAQFVDEVGMWRMTLTVPVLRRAADTLFLVAGASKAEAVRAALEGPPNGDEVPASLIRPLDGRVAWLLDAAAASALTHYRRAAGAE
ncbi:MAG TPA: 6-phosphogluconolactonase [bacterium]|nr:6-phosphogluconolactonase [bacterium]